MTILDKRHQIQDFTSEILIFIKRIILNFSSRKKKTSLHYIFSAIIVR